MDIHQITAVVEAVRAEQVAFLQKMVQTTSLPDHEHESQAQVAEKLKSLGLEVALVLSHFDELRQHPAFEDDGFSPTERVNVVDGWQGSGSGEGHSLILNGWMSSRVVTQRCATFPPGAALSAMGVCAGAVRAT